MGAAAKTPAVVQTGAAGRSPAVRLAQNHTVLLSLFTGTLFLSALLLFSVQPIFAKMVLPTLGGSPSVWAVSMCFFQAVLLLGYGYAHLLNRFLPARRAVFVHLPLLGLALLALPFGLPVGAEPPAGDAYVWLVGVLAVGVGLPFFAVSANAPLLQAWFARTGHPHGQDPYFLYGASNLGSMIALLSYPVVIEPAFGLADQAAHWSTGFVLLAVGVAMCIALVRMAPGGGDAARLIEGRAAPATTVEWSARLAWIALAFVPSGLLVAFTSHLTTDIASAPFLWVVPLATFLGTFVLVFRDEPVIPHRWLLIAQPILVALTLLGLAVPGSNGWLLGVLAGSGAFFVTTMVCHRQLFRVRPASEHLTEFYMWMSLGGVLGGIFTALIAPQIFNAVYEYPLLLVLGMLCRPGIVSGLLEAGERREALVTAGGGFALLLLLAGGIAGGLVSREIEAVGVLLVVGIGLLLTLAVYRAPLRQAGYVALMGLSLAILPSALNSGFSERSFFGVHRVRMADDGAARLLLHGTTLHGAMRIKDTEGRPVSEPLPATYYYPGSPMARGVDAARQNTGRHVAGVAGQPAGGLTVGSVGLGAGSMACHKRAGEDWRFFEIDPLVVKLARDPALFTFLSRCAPDAPMILGDARLTLAKEPDGAFDYLVIDAFASDSVPVHLLTREAIEMYVAKIAPGGLLALHLSNRHMDLIGVAGATALSVPGVHVALVDDKTDDGFDKAGSHVMFIAKSEAALAPVLSWPDAAPVVASDVSPWTDDYSNIFAAIWRAYQQGH